MSGPKISNCSQVASVYIKGGGEPRDIHCDHVVCLTHGFQFLRADGSFEFVSASIVDSFDVVPAAEPVGMKQ